jgi:oligoendopeptidase F
MARKSRDFQDLMRQNNSSRKNRQHIEELRDKMLEEGTFAEYAANMVIEPQGLEKMSDIMGRFIEPYADTVDNLRDFEALFSLAAIAWNIALMPDHKKKEKMDTLLAELFQDKDGETQEVTKEIITNLIARKQKYFSHVKRLIMDFKITGTKKKYHISVASTFIDNDEQHNE